MLRFRIARPVSALAVLAFVVAAALGGCSSARRAAQKPLELGDPEERVLGARVAAAFEDSERVFSDRQVSAYVNQIGQRLARLSDRPTIPYTFRILRGDTPRGLALPGGYIYVSVGLLKHLRSQCELAAVLAHLMAHASLGHPAKALERVDKVGPEGIREILGAADRREGVERARLALRGLKGYPREWESDADKLTLLYLARIGFTSEGYARSMEAFLPPATRVLEPYWETPDDRDTPLDKRLSGIRSEYSSMGLDAGLPCEQQPYVPIRARMEDSP